VGGKGQMGRPHVDSEDVHVRLRRLALDSLDAYIAAQPEPQPSRPEAVRRLLAEALSRPPDAGPTHGDPSPLDDMRRRILAWASDLEEQDGLEAMYKEAVNQLVASDDLDIRFGYWIENELSRLIKTQKGSAAKSNKKPNPPA
jgi:hypothetical protein